MHIIMSCSFLSFYQAKLDVGATLLSTHRLIWRDAKNHVRDHLVAFHTDNNDLKSCLFMLCLDYTMKAVFSLPCVGMLHSHAPVTDHLL